MKLRIQFAKGGPLRYIGHLDFLRVFGQSLRRSALPLAYSQGFNPHILLSFALPLPLGMASLHDYADITLTGRVCPAQAAAQLHKNTPGGLTVLRLYEYEGRSAAAITEAADYTFTADIRRDTLNDNIARLLTAPHYIIPKKTKSGVKDTDIRPDIHDIHTTPQGIVTLRLAAGSGRFLNPVTVATLLTGHEVPPGALTRTELYTRVGEVFVPLG